MGWPAITILSKPKLKYLQVALNHPPRSLTTVRPWKSYRAFPKGKEHRLPTESTFQGFSLAVKKIGGLYFLFTVSVRFGCIPKQDSTFSIHFSSLKVVGWGSQPPTWRFLRRHARRRRYRGSLLPSWRKSAIFCLNLWHFQKLFRTFFFIFFCLRFSHTID